MQNLKRIGLVLILTLVFGTTLTAQDPSVLLEEAIYAEETMGDLNEAISIYQQIVDNADANRATAAQALFRLGICHQKGGNTAEAQAAFSKLARLYPEQENLISSIPPLSSEELLLEPAPWVDGEVLQLSLGTAGTSGIGTQILSIESVQSEGVPGWKFRSIQSASTIGVYATVWMNSEYLPISSRQRSQMMGVDRQTNYETDHVDISTLQGEKRSSKQIPLNRIVYDEEQVALLLRCLPLRDGYKTTIPIFDSESASIRELEIAVVARETIAVPAGNFDCFKVVWTMGSAEAACWISRDHPFYPVKIDLAGLIDMELKAIARLDKSAPTHYQDSEHGVSLSLPPGWMVTSSKLGSSKMTGLIDPEGEANSILAMGTTPLDADPRESLSKTTDELISMYQSQYKGFEIRPGSRETTEISGTTAFRFIADHKALIGGQDSVVYMFVFATSDKICQLQFTTEQDNFDRMQPVFESIAYSIQIQ